MRIMTISFINDRSLSVENISIIKKHEIYVIILQDNTELGFYKIAKFDLLINFNLVIKDCEKIKPSTGNCIIF